MKDWICYYHSKMPNAPKRVRLDFIPNIMWLLGILLILMSFC